MNLFITIFLLTCFKLSNKINADVIVKVRASNVLVQAGKNSVIKIAIEVKNGYHIQGNKVKNEFIIPTTLVINGDKEIIIQKQDFPSTKKFKLEGTDEYLDVYDGTFEINIFFRAQKKIQKGVHRLYVKLNYQACDSKRCLFPKTIEFSIDVEVL